MFRTAENLLRLPGIQHGFFTRQGGVSTGIFASLNAGGRGTSDAAENVDENRRRIAAALEMPELLSVYQVHGTHAVTVTAPWGWDARPEADAMVTRAPGLGLGILTADCLPVLFADVEAHVVGAAHAGWKGAFSGVLEATIAAMETLGAKPARIHAAIGPAIAQASYEVDAAFRARFTEARAANAHYFTDADATGHSRFDLKRYAFDRLAHLGLGTINCLENDTYLEEDGFFSFRRATHRAEPDYGRQLSAIALTS